MKYLLIVLIMTVISGCSTKYDTVSNKDISLKIRSFWVDIDYDSRRCDPLPPLTDDGMEVLK